MFIQNICLPLIYRFYSGRSVKNKIIFADAHHDSLPFSMQMIHEQIKALDYEVVDCFMNYTTASFLSIAKNMFSFMKLYAEAKYVFICDYYLPVASCNKKPKTTVIQLWHSGGLMKKFAYDTNDDIPSIYKGNVFKNYDLVTVSSKCCENVLARAMKISKDKVLALGCNRTDIYYNHSYNATCKKEFYSKHPEAKNKKIVLWAPTFRGNASNPYLCGNEIINILSSQLSNDWYLIVKAHPHIDELKQTSTCNISSEKLLPLVDVLITDYSSILYDYCLYLKPFVLFAPDIEEYTGSRGLYIDYYKLPGEVITEAREITDAVTRAYNYTSREALEDFRMYYMSACDGHSTERILNYLNIN